MLTQRRIRRFNSLNWVVEEWQKGGTHPQTRVKGPDKWVITGYFSRLKHIPQTLIDDCLKDVWPPPSMKLALEDAEARCCALLREIVAQVDPEHLQGETPGNPVSSSSQSKPL